MIPVGRNVAGLGKNGGPVGSAFFFGVSYGRFCFSHFT